MAVAIAWLPGPAGTRRRVAKPSVEEPDAAEPARPDLWGARVSNDPGLPDREWAAVKHGGRGIRGWKKLHLGVDGSGVIVAHALTGGHVDDATTALDLIDKVEGDVSCLTADAAYDTRGIYEAAGARGATVVIPPTRTATVSGRRPRSPARDRTIRQVQQAGRRQWKKDSGYHQQARVENAFFRYKLIIGESLRARSRAGQETEAILACNILNQMTQLGRPASYAIDR